MDWLLFVGITGAIFVWVAVLHLRRQSRRADQSASALTKLIEERPAQCAAAINRFLDRVAPPIIDEAEVGRRSQAIAQVVLEASGAMAKAGVPINLAFESGSPGATKDAVVQMKEAELEIRRTRIDAAIAAGQPHEDLDAPLAVAQLTRVALEAEFKKAFARPDAYSGALWAKAVSANGRGQCFLAGLLALDPSGSLASEFASLRDGLEAMGHRFPVTPSEQMSYAALWADLG